LYELWAYISRKTPLEDATEIADCKSIIDILTLAADTGTEIEILVEGTDEKAKELATKLYSAASGTEICADLDLYKVEDLEDKMSVKDFDPKDS